MTGEDTSAASQQADSDFANAGADEHPSFDTSVAHIARVYNYWLGGKDNYAADRAAGETAIESYPYVVAGVREADAAQPQRGRPFLRGRGDG
jgi:S-adenosyl methyltransferase